MSQYLAVAYTTSPVFNPMGTKTTKFLLVPFTVLTLLVGGLGFQVNQTMAAGSQVSPIDPALATTVPNGNVAVSAATGFPLWYEDVSGGGGVRVQPCLGTNPDGTGPADPNCIVLDAAGAPLATVGAVSPLTFPTEVFYWVADAKMNVGGPASFNGTGSPAVFRMAIEGSFTNLNATPTPGQQTVFARVNFRLNKAGAFAPNETVTVNYPYGTMSFTTDAAGDINPASITPAAFAGVGSSAKQLRAQDGTGALNLDFVSMLGTPSNTGITTLLKSVTTSPGYLGVGGNFAVPTAVTGSPLGRNSVTVTGSASGVTTQTQFTVAGKLFSPTLTEVTPVPKVVATDTNTYTFSSNMAGTVASPETIIVGGTGCSSPQNGAQVASGNNTITINTVTPANSTATYNCTVQVTNGAVPPALSNLLAARAFTVDTRPPFLSTINITPVTNVVKVGGTQQITAAGADQFGAPIAAALTFASSNPAVGTVDGAGVFTALATGSTTITVTNAATGVTSSILVNANTLVISNIRVVSKTKASVTLAWDTSVPSNDSVKIGKTKNKKGVVGKTVIDPNNTTSHTLTIGGLKKSTRYFFQITSNDGTKTVKSVIKTVATAKK